jgi:hypothetical protein
VLKLNPNPTFKCPVKFNSPEGEQTLNLLGRHMTVEDHDLWWAGAVARYLAHKQALEDHAKAIESLQTLGLPNPEAALPEAPKMEKTGLDEIMDVVAGWEEVDAPFSREAMATLLSNYHDLTAKRICEAWSAGLTQYRVKN